MKKKSPNSSKSPQLNSIEVKSLRRLARRYNTGPRRLKPSEWYKNGNATMGYSVQYMEWQNNLLKQAGMWIKQIGGPRGAGASPWDVLLRPGVWLV